MLKIAKTMGELDYCQLLSVYDEQLKTGNSYSTESDFYIDLVQFLSDKDQICCLWASEGRYTACVRVEPYRDGALMTCLETAPSCRRQGMGLALVTSVLQLLSRNGCQCAYVHIAKGNMSSIALHKKAGFFVISDTARLVDGTVSQNFLTMKVNL